MSVVLRRLPFNLPSFTIGQFCWTRRRAGFCDGFGPQVQVVSGEDLIVHNAAVLLQEDVMYAVGLRCVSFPFFFFFFLFEDPIQFRIETGTTRRWLTKPTITGPVVFESQRYEALTCIVSMFLSPSLSYSVIFRHPPSGISHGNKPQTAQQYITGHVHIKCPKSHTDIRHAYFFLRPPA